MLPIRAGWFQMGSTDKKPGIFKVHPVHDVLIQMAFEMSETEVTQAQYQAVMGRNPSYYSDERDASHLPVERVSWFDAVEYCNALSKREGLTPCYQLMGQTVMWPRAPDCRGYRLPTEAEWEYAARTGGPIEYAGSNDAKEVAWIDSNSGNRPHRVGTKKANAWGLHDMSGNVREWVWDWYVEYSVHVPTADPSGPSAGDLRVLRGGSFFDGAVDARVASRSANAPTYRGNHVGFRLARSFP
jgi:formylglycine-generating enzyme required for sulfatase activity